MIYFFRTSSQSVIATSVEHKLSADEVNALCWLYGEATLLDVQKLDGFFVGPRREMITPWSTNAVEITQNMSLTGVKRIEEYFPVDSEDAEHDPMLQRMYKGLDQDIFTVNIKPAPIVHIENLEEYNLRTQRCSVSLRLTQSIAATRFSAVHSLLTVRKRSLHFSR